tara:strand:+ start:877 stop:1764 length:888 start_codon:yes stop_codon:yes gene_type:complete
MGTWKELVDTTSTQTLSGKTLDSATVATTQSVSDNSTKIATTAFAKAVAAEGDTSLTNKKIWVGNVSNEKAEVSVGGDLSITNAGVFTIGAEAVTYAKMQHVATANRVLGSTSADGDVSEVQVSTAMIAADAITGALIADDQINSEHYAAGSIDTAHIADDAVTASKLAHNLNLEGNVSVSGNLTVSGTHITTTTESLAIADNTIVLNSDLTGTVDVDAGIVVERADNGHNSALYWDEGEDKWCVGLTSGASLSSPSYRGDVMQVEISGQYTSDSTKVPVGHLQYHSGSLYLRVS